MLVIDDLHELDSEDALAWLEMLITQPPAQVRILLATREEPALGLHRLRLAGELTSCVDPTCPSRSTKPARFSAPAGSLSDQAVASLHERTEGWAAGLRLAALSLAAHPDPERFIRAGSERTVAGYLLAEVLERQAPEVRDLLLRTSVQWPRAGPTCSPVARGPRRSSSGSKTRTPSSPHWTPAVLGSATTTCSPISCASNCGASRRRRSPR